jgi:glycosyltransferase involved in cell wall biosynthesis
VTSAPIFLRRENYDVLHTHNTQAFIEAGLAALAARTPIRIHSDHNRAFPERLRYVLLERMVSWGFHKVVGVSQRTAEELHQHIGISRSKLTSIPNGIRPDAYVRAYTPESRQEGRRRHGLEGFSRVFGLGARMEPQKGLTYLLDAMPAILSRHPGTGLALAGPGSQIPELQAQARRLGIEDRVKFIPPMPDLSEFYPLLDYFVLPSFWEGMPLCILESMCLGIPIISTRVGGVPEILRDGENALLVNARDPAALANAACALLDDPALGPRLAARAREDFQAGYHADVMASRYLDLYRQFSGKRNGGG